MGPAVPHDHSRVLNLRPDEIHTNHSSQIVHAHFVNSTVQLDFMEELWAAEYPRVGDKVATRKYFQVPTRSQRYVSTLFLLVSGMGPVCFDTGIWLCLERVKIKEDEKQAAQLLRVV